MLVHVIAWYHQTTSHDLNQCWPSSMIPCGITVPQQVNTLRQRQNGRDFADDIFKCISVNENVKISIKISLNFVPMGPIDNTCIPALVQIMAWCRPGDKPSSEPMMIILLMHTEITQPQWVSKITQFVLISNKFEEISWTDMISKEWLNVQWKY